MDRATVFGEVADTYDRLRPRYPDAMFEDLMATAGLTSGAAVLEIGAGTGIATEGLLDRGLEVTVVEPDPRMLVIARRRLAARRFRIVEGRFEDVESGSFDVVFAAGSWHWVDPEKGIPRAAGLLASGGSLALAWNLPRPETLPRPAGLDKAYRANAPELAEAASQVRNRRQDHRRHAVVASKLFREPTDFHYRWTRTLATQEYCNLLATHSDHRMLGPERLQRLLSAVAGRVDAHGGTIELAYETVMYVARRLAG